MPRVGPQRHKEKKKSKSRLGFSLHQFQVLFTMDIHIVTFLILSFKLRKYLDLRC